MKIFILLLALQSIEAIGFGFFKSFFQKTRESDGGPKSLEDFDVPILNEGKARFEDSTTLRPRFSDGSVGSEQRTTSYSRFHSTPRPRNRYGSDGSDSSSGSRTYGSDGFHSKFQSSDSNSGYSGSGSRTYGYNGSGGSKGSSLYGSDGTAKYFGSDGGSYQEYEDYPTSRENIGHRDTYRGINRYSHRSGYGGVQYRRRTGSE